MTSPDPRPLLHRALAQAGALAEGRARIASAWEDDAVLDASMALPWATMPGRDVGWAYTLEMTVHAWDLAGPLGLEATLDGELAEATADVARRVAPAEPRGGPEQFDPPVEVDDAAGAYARLVAWLGRTP